MVLLQNFFDELRRRVPLASSVNPCSSSEVVAPQRDSVRRGPRSYAGDAGHGREGFTDSRTPRSPWRVGTNRGLTGMSARPHGAECDDQKAEVFHTNIIRGLENRTAPSSPFVLLRLNSARHARYPSSFERRPVVS